jgi:RNA polymerase sigma-70 factor (ECF subfamily)
MLPLGGRTTDTSQPEPNPAERVVSGGPSPEDTLLSRERRREIAAALARLPERQRAVFVLSHVEGHTSREVSALTGLNESTVRVHLFRAIRKLRTLLGTEDAAAGERQEKKRRVTS